LSLFNTTVGVDKANGLMGAGLMDIWSLQKLCSCVAAVDGVFKCFRIMDWLSNGVGMEAAFAFPDAGVVAKMQSSWDTDGTYAEYELGP
jgi:hypothetical protein